MKVLEGLMNFTYIIEFESGEKELKDSALIVREHLRELLDKKNGDTTPKYYAFGHSHLDYAWKWPIEETKRKIQRTLSNQLTMIDIYSDYIFFQGQPALLKLLKENNENLYSRVKTAIKNGNIIADGGMFLEADTNITGGESLIRQFIFGKKFLKEEFGKDSIFCWLPDVFGYTGSLPQIMKKCDIEYFSSTKIFLNYNGGEEFPYNSFMW